MTASLIHKCNRPDSQEVPSVRLDTFIEWKESSALI